jgi:hypothetical protein
MIFPTGTIFQFSHVDFQDAFLRLECIEFNPENGVFDVDMLLLCGIFGKYLVDRAPRDLIKSALLHTFEERGLPEELALNAGIAIDANALRFSFSASIEVVGNELIKTADLIEKTDYQYLTPRCVEIFPTGVMKLGADPNRIAEESLALLPKRYHWVATEDNYQKYVRRTAAGFSLNLDLIDYENIIEGDGTEDDELSPMAYVLLSHKLRLWQ